ncbi:hypothetical protein Tco_1230207 [Tanacetum coccineum]
MLKFKEEFKILESRVYKTTPWGEGDFKGVRNDMPVDKHMDFMMARIIEARFEDERATTSIANPNDLNKARPDQVLEESTSHTSDKVEAVSTSMIATYEEHGCQDGLKHITTTSVAGKKGDLGAISSKEGPPDHMQASEKDLAILKSPLKEKSMSMCQERMLRRQEQQRLAKDAKIQKRIWDPGIKIF